MHARWTYRLIAMVLALIVSQACKREPNTQGPLPSPTEQPEQLRLRWVKAYPDETQEQVLTGLRWAFSFLGAELPAGSFEQAVTAAGSEIKVDLDGLGFDQQARDALVYLNFTLRGSAEYDQHGGVDLGRFVALTINASHHYYAITGMPSTLEEFEAYLDFSAAEVAIVESAVADAERLIAIPDSLDELGRCAFVASEGGGSIADGNFTREEYEVTDLMPNGQFRFGIYDAQGQLIPAGDPALGVAGKPAKCMWCHESSLQPPYIAQTEVQGYHAPEVLEQIVQNRTVMLRDYRRGLQSDIDFEQTQEHAQMELLYISFMEPSAARLANEWGMSEAMVAELLSGLPTHTHPEFSFLGTLYDRADVDPLAPYTTIRVSDDARERSDYEPDLIE